MAEATLTTAGARELVPYVVKTIAYRKYVYFQQRVEGKVITKYIGPLDKIVEFYIAHHGEAALAGPPGLEPGFSGRRAFSGSGERPRERWQRELDALVKKTLTAATLREFRDWLVNRGVWELTVRDYVSYVQKPFDAGNRWSVRAYRSFLKFLQEKYGVEVERFLAKLRIPKSKMDLSVPSDEEVLNTLRTLKGSKYYSAWLLAVASGLRAREIHRILAQFDPSKLTVRDGICVYELQWLRGSKRAYHAFWPEWLKLEKVEGLSYKAMVKAGSRDVVALKYVRKWVAQRMIDLGIPAEIVDFVQSRAPLRHVILFTHYASLLNRAVAEYRKYAEWLKTFLAELA